MLCAALYSVTPQDIDALDTYEGYDADDPELGLYNKVYITIKDKGIERSVLLYQMNRTGIMPPSEHYLQSIVQGYKDWGLDLNRLQRALDHSWWRARKTPFLARRYRRKGLPKLATTLEC